MAILYERYNVFDLSRDPMLPRVERLYDLICGSLLYQLLKLSSLMAVGVVIVKIYPVVVKI